MLPTRIHLIGEFACGAQLCIDQAVHDRQLSMKVSRCIDAQSIQPQRSVGCQPNDAAVFKLHLRLTVVACGQPHPFGQRHVDLGQTARCVVQMIDGHVALQIAQPGRTVRRSIVRARAGNTC
jgi:hypothetical protein